MGAGHDTLASWLEAYERAWREPGTAALRDLFGEDASYRTSPYAEPAVGLERIAALWEREREGPDEGFEMTSEVVAVDGDVGVARVEVRYATGEEYRDLWVVRFGSDGRCSCFEEWPFWPGQQIAPSREEAR
jgi:SnoaL-like domain